MGADGEGSESGVREARRVAINGGNGRMEKYIIKTAEDRRELCAILAENGYTVKVEDVKVGNTAKKAVVVWKDEENGK